jgi:enoyl-CoA hydratase/carnithine racemase
MGLVQKVFNGDCFEQAVAFAERLATTVSPQSLAVMKRQIWEHPRMSDDEALRYVLTSVRAEKRAYPPRLTCR